MIKTTFLNKCKNYNFEKLFADKGYAYFTKGYYNLNIIGIRASNGNKVTNSFDDALVVIYRNGNEKIVRKVYIITTEPGAYYMLNRVSTEKGTAILVPGQYRGCWQIGNHKGKYKALCQKKPVSVYRDSNYDGIYDMNPETIDKGIFGINIHRSNEFVESKQIDKWSAGCQVFGSPFDFKDFMRLCEQQKSRYGNSFTYTLITESDLI